MEKEIEIRSLNGESMIVSIAGHRSIGELKALLKESFLPAKNSPNFHLFFKGEKLRLESRMENHQIEHGEFMVLVPFTKKTQRFSVEPDPPGPQTGPSKSSRESMVSSAAESAWLDIMNDLSSLSDVAGLDGAPSNFSLSNKLGGGKEEALKVEGSSKLSLNTKRKREPENDHVLRDILRSDFKNVFEQQTSDRISQFVESASCLSSPTMGSCLLFEEFFTTSKETGQCVCPSWLKRVLKNFTFLNIFYAFFHIQGKCMTWDCIEEALKNRRRIGLDDICISDVENLSLLCPKVVVILGLQENMVTKLGSAIVIGNPSTDLLDQSELTKMLRTARKKTPTSAVINATEKREVAFKTELWRAIKCCMEKNLSKTSFPFMLSLEDLILMKDGFGVSEGSEVRPVKTRSLASVCHSLNPMEAAEMIEHLRQGIGKHGQIVHVQEIDAKEAVYVELPNDLSETLKCALNRVGISRLYSHQAEAMQASLSGKNIVVATSTSSGKSLCYNVPVLESLSQNLLSCAIYIFPTKALAQDQLKALLEMTRGLDMDLTVGVYDGDTSQEHRIWIKDNARLLITNPDMLHMSILPYHGRFQRILSNLRYIVIDETHSYKGAFGCHMALILRRLRRICFHAYGSDPAFIFCTATSANPREHAMELANLQNLDLIQNDGSPCSQKHFLLWNPPLRLGPKAPSSRNDSKNVKSDVMTRRSSSIMEVSYLFAEMVQHGLRCIAFCKTRKLCELVLCYTREILQEIACDLVGSISVYRAGYTPQERRRIEAELFEGKLHGVAATNALELGIDVGHIDATLHLGFPGSVASLWQQAGRSGRRARPSLAVYVALEGPLDQYFMKFPHKLFGSPIEHCQVDAHNQKCVLQVLEQHIACAAYELPLCLQYDEKYFGSGLDCAITALKLKGYLSNDHLGVSSSKVWNYIGPEERPSHAVSIRAIETDRYKVVDMLNNEVLEEIEESRAFYQVYEGAVYMHQGVTHLVKELDSSRKIAFCQKADLKYYTKTRDYTDIIVTGDDLGYPPVRASEFEKLRTTAQANACKVTTKWFGFYRIWRASNRIFDRVELSLPSYSFESQAAWIRIPPSVKTAVEMQNLPFRAGMHAASHALLNVVPLHMMCNTSDLGTECANPHETRAIPERILLYDQHPGGIGITAQVQLLFGELLTAALELISACNCMSRSGCPNCVQVLSCSEYNEVLDKEAAIVILVDVIEAEKSYFEGKEKIFENSAAN
ncbi:uncharacterized ATP-dependent helicase YprA-like isoform X1 [Phoenix dactylifera]|uniref:Uncharacterized ATP-dependent helicase YprA-like isoform X1 n=1 Tax=Phoenix dactylifera TaxID=42345 RepID=A0A8B9A9Z6_PHODC|nr:uncharacterized ATP-dependent helicase YprA-like isoform X1 [Phoenix dactylifera]XP_038983506.1 uncharacterized ATP-dependent helicase YprA-like isoform X1 [Phoenix dactylifera]XP_038983507.1 uncharacterized ATP-dependent helicase YprA-like isoform X1 [Phoenix dactylifera]